ncbi:tripartite tricarboxylate transporter substrate binding protein [Muricoccus radiodurans]|uniref:tripartite tricarboxylate transporter substrate binding protein n=1 Tax=Muricoccus radiodurans TaxID=2231721 RepID=UPI003CF4C80D
MKRRPLLLAALLAAARPALAQTGWPNRPLRIIVPFAPGSFTDTGARLLGVELTDILGQQVVVENRGGAGGTIGATAVVRSPPDGYTLLLTDNSLAMSVGLYPNLPYDPLRDLAQVSRIADSPSILLARPGLGVKTVAELVNLAKAKPGEVTFGSGGQGSSAHLATEQLMSVAGIRMQHIPFRGVAAAQAEVIAERVDVVISSIASGVPHVRQGTLTGLAVSGPHRSEQLPDIPTFIEAGFPGYDMSYWFGVAAPAATPPEIVTRLSQAIAEAARRPRLRDAYAAQSAEAVSSTPEEMRAHVAREIETWRTLIQRVGVRAE